MIIFFNFLLFYLKENNLTFSYTKIIFNFKKYFNNMNITFDYKVVYLFKQLEIDKEHKIIFVLSLIPVLLFCFFSSYNYSKTRIIKRSSFLKPIIFSKIVTYICQIIVMFLLMTCNGWVILTCILGLFFGYLGFHSKYRRKISSEEHLEKLCC